MNLNPSLLSDLPTKIRQRMNPFLFILFGYPWVLSLVSSEWLHNKMDIDVWFYSGYFEYFNKFWWADSPSILETYYGTRVPYTLYGYPFFQIFGPALGHKVLAIFSF